MVRQTLHDVTVDRSERYAWISVTKVVYPAGRPAIDFTDHNRRRLKALTWTSQVADRVSGLRHSLTAWNDVQVSMRASLQVAVVSEGIPQKVQGTADVIELHDFGFGFLLIQ